MIYSIELLSIKSIQCIAAHRATHSFHPSLSSARSIASLHVISLHRMSLRIVSCQSNKLFRYQLDYFTFYSSIIYGEICILPGIIGVLESVLVSEWHWVQILVKAEFWVEISASLGLANSHLSYIE